MSTVIQKKTQFAAEDDPRRCKAILKNGSQCYQISEDENNFCLFHSQLSLEKQIKEETRNYALTRFKARVDDFADNPKVKNLREEIGIVRLVLEELLNQCSDAEELLIASSKITMLVGQIQRLVESAHRIENQLGLLLDRAAAMQFAEEIIKIIQDYVPNAEDLGEISEKIVIALKNVGKSQGTFGMAEYDRT